MATPVSEYFLVQPINFGHGNKYDKQNGWTAALDVIAGATVLVLMPPAGATPNYYVPLSNVAFFRVLP